jgi:hypothetical protein
MSNTNGIAMQYRDSYQSWLKHTARVSSLHNAVSFIKHQVLDWHARWGHTKTDQIAQALHHLIMSYPTGMDIS